MMWPPALSKRPEDLQKQKDPGCSVKKEVEPVQWPSQAPPGEHDEFLPHVGRAVGRQAQGEAGDDEQVPAETVNESIHKINDYQSFPGKGKPGGELPAGAVTGMPGLARGIPSSIILAEERRRE